MRQVRRLRYGMRRAIRVTALRPSVSVWSTVAIATAIVMVGIALLGAQNIDRWAMRWRGGATMVAYLDAAVSDDRARAITTQLGDVPGVLHAEYVPPAEADRRLRTALGRSDQLLDGVDPSALPASVELVLEPGARDVVVASPRFASLRASDSVDDVELAGEWVDQMGTVMNGVRTAAWALVSLFGIFALIIVASTLRLGLQRNDQHAHSDAHISRLLGASTGYLAMPSVVSGVMHGAAGACFAIPTLWWLHHQYGGGIASALTQQFGSCTVAFLPYDSLLLLLGASCALGLVAGLIAGIRHAVR